MSSRRWFHPNISTVEAEKLLLKKGFNGSFLVHLSTSNPDAFTLSVRKDQKVIHIGIQNTGYFLHVDSDEIFATLTELVQYYMKIGVLKREDGEVIKLKQPLLRTGPSTVNHSGNESGKLLLNRGTNGSPGDFSLSIQANNKVRHAVMHCQNDKDDSVNSGHYKYNGLVETRHAEDDLSQRFNAARVATASIDACVGQIVKDGFCEELESLCEGSSDKLYCQEGYKLVNRNKNRYGDVLPHDHTRVKLIDVDHSIAGADYINANYISLPLDSLHANSHSTRVNTSTTHAAAQMGKSCANGQLFGKGLTKAKCAGATASLPVNNCVTCSKKSNSVCKHRHGESVIKASKNKNICAVRSLRNISISNANKGNAPLVEKNLLCKSLSSNQQRLKTYIATQGCLPNTITDFWNMIWQENTRVIVMLTREVERGRSKCAKYWTNKGQRKQFGPVKIHCISEDSFLGEYILREFLVSWGDQTERHIYHYHFQAWPDHGVPTNPDCVLDFLNYVNTKQNQLIEAGKEPGPICVHCSAGIGRTGTLIVIDMILDQIDKYGVNTEIDIKRTIQMARLQRAGLVQTEAQYKFIHYALQRYIQRICKKY
ncbi:tyrosine-protein phosphatase corkscrew-like [Glossina fuscipes]|uniref:protein-tyrosine-phosphatase n=1 Tax=Glossina fuscipes TaxID=7396 RepID=A0A8U0WAC4_9MUSC|nr:tyrosine-protein phosphatase corkscrew-like [Glossina fuscipes]KAI9585336.1 hypothetical protein GQX74_001183 [Glossina fuscipes]